MANARRLQRRNDADTAENLPDDEAFDKPIEIDPEPNLEGYEEDDTETDDTEATPEAADYDETGNPIDDELDTPEEEKAEPEFKIEAFFGDDATFTGYGIATAVNKALAALGVKNDDGSPKEVRPQQLYSYAKSGKLKTVEIDGKKRFEREVALNWATEYILSKAPKQTITA